MKGLYQKYIVTKTSGDPVDLDAQYIILRIDSGEYVDACRIGVRAFAEAVEPFNHELSWDLQMELLGLVRKDIKQEPAQIIDIVNEGKN